jgi:hypothetical protein
MHRTLYSTTMIETFRACKRAYALTFLENSPEPESLSFICKQFLLRAVAQINRGKITTISQMQKYIGQYWPAERLGNKYSREAVTKAFLSVYKTSLHYLAKPYRPAGSRIVGVALSVRARVPHVQVYIEDTFDLILWYPAEKKLELVDFSAQPLKAADPSWPCTALLVKKYLAEKLQTRWPYKRLAINSQRLGLQDYAPDFASLDESINRLHWPEVIKDLEQMKVLENKEFEDVELRQLVQRPHEKCRHCQIISSRLHKYQFEQEGELYLTA